ncbi:unnamed protein product [Periconia digitata]|uniref:LisH domain-containing protein n=1 Tax=Periconia digitata TaxID=1303443 RepID=A0A9W4UPF9_9PLEO|nr:unnamed protein product [Periconia digitata]
MQNPQMAAAMAANMNAGGPVTGTPIMNNGQRRPQVIEPRDHLNTYIYDYFLRNGHPQIARMMIKCELELKLGDKNQKTSPSGRNVNGVDSMDDSADDLPPAELPHGHVTETSFLSDWWFQFWDIFSSARGGGTAKSTLYTGHVRNITQLNNQQRNDRMMMTGGMNGMNGMNPQQYGGMMRNVNGMPKPNELQRAAMNNRNPGQAAAMANMNLQKQQAMMGAQMQRDGSQMEMNGRPQSPGSNDNAASPNKRQRVEGGMNAANGSNQFNEFGGNVQQKSIEGMNAGAQGSPLIQPGALDGSEQIFVGNNPNRMPPGQAGQPPGNHALQDYQMQLMLLEQQNKKRLLMARQEQDNMSGQGVGGPAQFSAAMSPQGSSRAGGPSPNPTDQMKKNTPRMGAQVLPGSPMPDGMMQPQRNSPAPNMPYDPNAPPQGFPQTYPGLPGQMPTTPMMRQNPSSHPGQFNGQQLTPAQMEAMQRTGGMQPNGAWRAPPGQPGMMPGQQQMGPMGGQPQPRGQMPPPPAPANEPSRPQVPSPSQPSQAPPTPSQGNKPNPKKKNTKDTKKPANKKGTGATPAASGAEEPPTPTTPMHKNFGQNGQQQPSQASAQPQPPAASQQQPPQPQQQHQPPMENNAGPPFGNIPDDTPFTDIGFGGFDDGTSLDTFDFESFLHVGDNDGLSNGFDSGLDFGVEAGGDGIP